MKSTQFYKNTSSIFSALAVSLAGSPAVQAESSEQSLTFSTAQLAEFNSEITVYSSPEDYTFPSTLAMQNAQAGETSPSTLFDDPREDDEDEDDDQQYSLASLQGSQQPVTAYSGTRSIPMSVFSSSGGKISYSDTDIDSIVAAVDYTVDYSTTAVSFVGTSSADKPTLGSLSGSVKLKVTGSTATGVTGVSIKNADVGSISSIINVESSAGVTTGLYLENTSVDSITGIKLDITNTAGFSNTHGIVIKGDTTVGITPVPAGSKDVALDISLNAKFGTTLISTNDATELGQISGRFNMTTSNAGSTSGWQITNTFSVGYILGMDKSSTSSGMAFSAPSDLGGSGVTDSTGYNVDWNNINLTIHRDYGLAAGAAVVDRTGTYFGEMAALLKYTSFGAGSQFHISVNEGLATATWLNGMDVSNGKLLGTMSSTALHGSSVGLMTVGTDQILTKLVTQSRLNTSLGHVSGTIRSTVLEETAGSTSVGVMLANVTPITVDGVTETVAYNTSVKEFSGDITATMYKEDASSDTIVAGIIDMGTQVLNFNADANGTTWDQEEIKNEEGDVIQAELKGAAAIASAGTQANDTTGTSVNALIYDANEGTANPKVIGLGHAILTLAGGITVNSVGTRDADAKVTFVGNLTAGSAGDQTITFMKGNYNVTSDRWAASEGFFDDSKIGGGVTLGTKTTTPGGLHDIARVNLMDLEVNGGGSVGKSTAIVAETLNFTANSSQSASQIHVGDENALHLTGLVEVNIYLTGDESSYDSTVYFVDARNSSMFTTNGEVYDSVVAESTGETKYKYNIYFGDSTTAHTQHDGFKVVHDGTGIYLQVPEPSTATLSLLALTSLMARRRRRHV